MTMKQRLLSVARKLGYVTPRSPQDAARSGRALELCSVFMS